MQSAPLPPVSEVVPGVAGRGVVSVPSHLAEDLVPDLIVRGYEVVGIDASDAPDNPEVVRAIVSALHLPEDAASRPDRLWAALRDLPATRPRRGLAVVWRGPWPCHNAHEGEWGALEALLRDVSAELASVGFAFETVLVDELAGQRVGS